MPNDNGENAGNQTEPQGDDGQTTTEEKSGVELLDEVRTGDQETNEQKAARETEEAAARDKNAEKVTPKPGTDTSIAKAITDGLREALRPQVTPQQQEEQLAKIAESRGITVEALKAQYADTQHAAMQANLPMARELGRMKAEKALGEYSEELIAEVQNKMDEQPMGTQANPSIWEECAYLIMGKKMKELSGRGKDGQSDGKSRQEEEKSRVITASGNGLSGARTSSVRTGSGKKSYSEAEQYVIRKQFSGKAEEYEKFRTQKTTNHVERFTVPTSGGNRADSELAKLTAENS